NRCDNNRSVFSGTKTRLRFLGFLDFSWLFLASDFLANHLADLLFADRRRRDRFAAGRCGCNLGVREPGKPSTKKAARKGRLSD
ncbi:MAG TPA: hypothetical protein VJ226_04710, partial [Bradyrhizobium sp.]|nr:hypothetical protein [Bradyrhizobium sp.]